MMEIMQTIPNAHGQHPDDLQISVYTPDTDVYREVDDSSPESHPVGVGELDALSDTLGAVTLNAVLSESSVNFPLADSEIQRILATARKRVAEAREKAKGAPTGWEQVRRIRNLSPYTPPAYSIETPADTIPQQSQETPTPKPEKAPFSVPFSNIHHEYVFSDIFQPTMPIPPPEAKFSAPESPQQSPPPRPYTPQFNLNFKDVSFTPEATAMAEQALESAAAGMNVKPGDALGRVDIARKALEALHPDKNPDTAFKGWSRSRTACH